MRGLYHALPDLSAFDIKTNVVHGLAVPAGYVAAQAAYGLAYVAPYAAAPGRRDSFRSVISQDK